MKRGSAGSKNRRNGMATCSGCLRLPGRKHSPGRRDSEASRPRLMIVIARGHQGPWLTDHAISQSRATVWSSVSWPCPLSIRPTHPPHAPAKTLPIVPRGARRKVDDGCRPGAWGMVRLGLRRQQGGWSPGSSAIERGLTRATVAVPMAIANGHWTIPSRQMQRYPTPKSPAVVGTRTNTRRAAYGRCSC